MPENLENSGHRIGKGQFSFQIPKKSNAKECSNCHTIALFSYASKFMLKILEARLQQYVNWELADVQAWLRKGRGTRDQIANILLNHGESKGVPEKPSTSASLTMLKPLTVWITTNWKILKEKEVPDHLTCLLRNLYIGQNTTVKTGHRATDWFQIGKGVW